MIPIQFFVVYTIIQIFFPIVYANLFLANDWGNFNANMDQIKNAIIWWIFWPILFWPWLFVKGNLIEDN